MLRTTGKNSNDQYFDQLPLRFGRALKDCYNQWRATAEDIIKEELNAGAKAKVEEMRSRLRQRLSRQFHWISWYPVVYDQNDYWDSGKDGYLDTSGDLLKVSGGGKHVAAMFTPHAEGSWPSTKEQCDRVNELPREVRSDFGHSCMASRYTAVLASIPNAIGTHVLRAYYVNNDSAKDKWKYSRPDPGTFFPMVVGEEICRVGALSYQRECEMRISVSLDLRENRTNNPCNGNPCGRHGTCYRSWEYSSEALCHCHPGFSGDLCQEDLNQPIVVPSFADIKVGAVDLVSIFYGLRDELYNVQRNLSSKIDALELTIETLSNNQTRELKEARAELVNGVQRLTDQVQEQAEVIQDGLINLRNQFDAESQLLYSQLFYADERKLIHLVSDYYTELLTNQLTKTDFLKKMADLNAPTFLNFDIVQRRYSDWLSGRGSIDSRGGIVTGFKRKYWLKYPTKVEQYKNVVEVVKNYVIMEFSWFVKGWREYEMLVFQKDVQQFSRWKDVRSIFETNGIVGLKDDFGEVVKSPLTEAFPQIDSLLQFQVGNSYTKYNFIFSWSAEQGAGSG